MGLLEPLHPSVQSCSLCTHRGNRERPPIQTTNLGPVPRAISHVRIRIHAYICACNEFQPPHPSFYFSLSLSLSPILSLSHPLSSSISLSLASSFSLSLYLVLAVFFLHFLGINSFSLSLSLSSRFISITLARFLTLIFFLYVTINIFLYLALTVFRCLVLILFLHAAFIVSRLIYFDMILCLFLEHSLTPLLMSPASFSRSEFLPLYIYISAPLLFFCLSVAFSFSHSFSLSDHCGA